jgi:hypothetical protein
MGIVDSLDVFKYVCLILVYLEARHLSFRLIQAMHLGSTGMTALVSMKSDFSGIFRGL